MSAVSSICRRFFAPICHFPRRPGAGRPSGSGRRRSSGWSPRPSRSISGSRGYRLARSAPIADYLRVGYQPVDALQALRSSSSVSQRVIYGMLLPLLPLSIRVLSRLQLVFPLLGDRLRPDCAQPRRIQLRLDPVEEACGPSKTMARRLRNSSVAFMRCAWWAVSASSGYSSRGRLAITAVATARPLPGDTGADLWCLIVVALRAGQDDPGRSARACDDFAGRAHLWRAARSLSESVNSALGRSVLAMSVTLPIRLVTSSF